MYTANTMSSATIEALGLSLPFSSTMAAEDDERSRQCGRLRKEFLPRQSTKRSLPRQLLTKAAFENAIAVVMAVGEISRCRSARLRSPMPLKVELTLDDFERIRKRNSPLCSVI